jgi:hypothetical protein
MSCNKCSCVDASPVQLRAAIAQLSSPAVAASVAFSSCADIARAGNLSLCRQPLAAGVAKIGAELCPRSCALCVPKGADVPSAVPVEQNGVATAPLRPAGLPCVDKTAAQLVSLSLDQCRSTRPLPIPSGATDPCEAIGSLALSCETIAKGGLCTAPFTDKDKGLDVCPVACQQCVATCVNPYHLTVVYTRRLDDTEIKALLSAVFELGKTDRAFVDQDRSALTASPTAERYVPGRPRSAGPAPRLA